MKDICIIIPTFNHPRHIEEWINHSYEYLASRNIDIHIYDSSANKETDSYIQSLDRKNIFYHYYDGRESSPDNKVRTAFSELVSYYRYIWLCGDGILFDFEKCFSILDAVETKRYSAIHFSLRDFNLNRVAIPSGGTEVDYLSFVKNFIHGLTLYGSTIYSNEVILKILKCDFRKYNGTGFFPQFVVIEVIDEQDIIYVVEDDFYTSSICKKKTDSGVFVKKTLFNIWVDNWVKLVDELPYRYHTIKNELLSVESKSNLSIKGMIKARIYGILTLKNLRLYWKKFERVLTYSRIWLVVIVLFPRCILKRIFWKKVSY